MPDLAPPPEPAAKHLQCMEIWGGNRFVESAVELPGLDAWVYSRPHGTDAGGGDVHYVSSCAAGMIARLLVADVAGHGERVAETARRLRKLMQRHIVDHDQLRLMRSLNREFAAVSVSGRFATAVAFTFDATRGHLIASNAGHPPPLWYRAAAGEWTYLESGEAAAAASGADAAIDAPFGIDESVEYGRYELELGAGDVVIAYTDSLPEAPTADGRMLGKDGLLDAARSLGFVTGAAKLGPALLAAITARTGRPFTDDVTLLAFSPNGRRKHIPVYDRVVAPLRYLRAVAGSYLS